MCLIVAKVAKVSSSVLYAKSCSMRAEMRRTASSTSDSVTAASIAATRNVLRWA